MAKPGEVQRRRGAVDRADSADYSEISILAPDGWTQLNFLLDPRTGLSRIGHFSTSQEDLMKDMAGTRHDG